MHDARIEFLSILSSQILFRNWKFNKYDFGIIFEDLFFNSENFFSKLGSFYF
ncbi:hypothetical protein LEP1GSC016_0947 [Leptospira borgpetersenii serovar Hardjo-bovis str. Sponselee]|uniref:Uncharacterized protein n=2 Tax=Leptospira borgpetersenii TaxID=174 RepID=M6BHZ6_LEPBO|nr:hypothetical protein LEP1GSC016_0947 [Leptospira borgpetersenii serovar Hardjo-bovis str. Sponselee]EMO63625.1 hypothetical protein LEP1GSC133_1393 [Leptospira borgpetersenii serovar Pomona str. 200901868]